MPVKNLEDKLNSKDIGLTILELIKRNRIKRAAELAYIEFGLERAIKIFINNCQGDRAGMFAESKGYFERAFRLYVELGIKKHARRLSEQLGIPIYRESSSKKPLRCYSIFEQ